MDKLKQSAEFPRKQMGFIKFPNRSYPVYEGLNIIGRDPKATVRVKDLTFSKQHATIVIINDSTHFVSDFGSSNGTEFRLQKLIPFKLYEIKDQESITFGDVLAEYHTGADPNFDKENYFNETQSQFMDANATTQLLAHNIHELPTQQIIIENKNDKNTKTDTQNIHEAETQQILKTNDGVDDQLLSKPTAILETQNNNTCTEHYGDMSRSELYDDIFANETFRKSLENAGSKYQEVVDETIPTDPKLNKSNDVSMDSDDIILSTQDNANIEQHTQQIILKRSKPDSKNNPLNKDDDDSATDIEDEEEFKKKIQQKSTQVNDSKTNNDSDSSTDAEEDLAKKIDDSATDIEDDLIANCEYNTKPSNIQKSQEPQNKMSDENDEALLLVPTQLLDNTKTANIDDESDDDDVDLLAGAPPELLQEQSIEEDDNNDDLLTVTPKNHKNKEPEQYIANKNQVDDEGHETDDDLLAPTQLLTATPKNPQNKKLTANKNQVDDDGDETDDDLLAPTQLLTATPKNPQNKKLTANKNQVDDDGDETDDDLLAPTQLLTATPKNPQNKKLTANKNQVDDDGDETDDDLIAPTQLLTATPKNHQNKKLTANKNQVDDDGDETDDDLLAPTQLLTATPKNHQNKESEQSTDNKNQVDDDGDDTDDDLLAPTQLLERKSNDKAPEKTDNDLAPKIPDNKVDDDDDLLAPTQLLSGRSNESGFGLKPTNDDDLLAPTQLLQSKNVQNIDDDDDLAPTQLLSNEKIDEPKNANDSIFSAPTQILEKSPFTSPKSILSTKSPKIKVKRSVNFSEDLIYDMPTQKLDTSVDKNIYEAPTQILENKQSLENVHEAPTQLLKDNKTKSLNDSSSMGEPSLDNTQESENASLKLVLSETDDECPDLSKINQSDTKTSPKEFNPQVETQLEVDFDLETQKLYVEEKTSRPDNPLGHMFAEEPTQMTEDIIENKSEPNIEENKPKPKIEDIQTTRRLQVKLSNKIDLSEDKSDPNREKNKPEPKIEDIKTSKRLQVKHSSRADLSADKSEPKPEETKPESKIEVIKTSKRLQVKHSSRADLSADKSEPKPEETKPESKIEVIKTSKRLQVKHSSRADLSADKSEPKPEETKPESKIEVIKTSKRLQVKHSSRADLSADKSEPKPEETKPESKIEVIKTSKRLQVKHSSRADLSADKSEPKREETKPESKIEVIKTSKRLQVKHSSRADLSADKSEPEPEETKPEPKIEDIKAYKILQVNLSNIVDQSGDKSEPKRKETKLEPKIEDINTSKRLQVKHGNRADLSGDKSVPKCEENKPEPKVEDKETHKRLHVTLSNITDISKASTSKTNSSTSDEADFKPETKRGRPKKQQKEENISKFTITKVKHSEVNQNKKQEEKRNESPVKSSETDEDKAYKTRGKRISYKKLNTGKEEPKKTTRGRKKVEEEEVEVKKTPRRTTKLQTPKIEDKNDEDLDDFINRVTRSKRTHSVAETPKKKTVAEDSDSDDNIVTKKKIKKLEYTQDTEPMSSINSEVVREKPAKRSMKIENYSSDENTDNTTSFCVNTPNTKRRRYEPLNVTLNNIQGSGETIKHKVVFTMLSDPTLETSVKKLGASITDSAQLSTVLVTNKISRSLKFLTAVALGKPIVQAKWIHDSIKKNVFQDPWNYLLEDTESEAKFDFSLKDSLNRSSEKLLLTDMVFLLAGKKNYDVLKEIIETSGGKCIARAPAKNTTAIVVSYEEEKAKYAKYLKQKNLTVVSAEAIFSGVLKQEVNWKKHLLS